MSERAQVGRGELVGDRELVGHRELVEGLWRAVKRGRLPHALCFEGPAGVGKFLAASTFVAGILCAGGPGWPCETCGPCRRRRAGSHPDLFVLDPVALDLETIPVARVARREKDAQPNVEEFVALRPAEGGWRAVVLREFQRANEAAQNALLKVLEEPGEATVLILETARPDLLLETIRSRCARVHFAGLSARDCAAVLAREGLSGERAARLARWAEGSPGRALALQREGAEEVRRLLEEALRGERQPFELAALLPGLAGEFAGKTELARARSRARAAAELALAVVRDLARLRAGVAAEELAHGGLCARLSGGGSDHRLRAAVDALLQARQDVDANLPPEGVLDRVGLALAALRPVAVSDS